jgi:hypothetical protein
MAGSRTPTSGKLLNSFVTPDRIRSAALKAWYRADQGITIATGVSQWNDLSGNAYHLAQSNTTKQPTYNATDASFNSQATMTFDGSNDVLFNSILPVGFNTTFVVLILKQIAWAGQSLFCGDIANSCCVVYQYSGSVSPQISIYNNNVGNTNGGAPIGVAKRIYASFTNSTADYLQVGSTKVTGTNVGPLTSNGWEIGGSTTGSNNANFSAAEMIIYNGTPADAELAVLDTYFSARYGAGVLT